MTKPRRRFYGYGIVGKSGDPWWDEACVCQDRAPMDESVQVLTDAILNERDTQRPYRVVRLFYETRKRK